eukprot:1137092-Pelagomonas_calceolata.AAC.3
MWHMRGGVLCGCGAVCTYLGRKRSIFKRAPNDQRSWAQAARRSYSHAFNVRLCEGALGERGCGGEAHQDRCAS